MLAIQLTGEIGVVGGCVPGVAGDGTSISGPVGGAPGGAGEGVPGCGGAGWGVDGGLAGVGGNSGIGEGVSGVAGGVPGVGSCCIVKAPFPPNAFAER